MATDGNDTGSFSKASEEIFDFECSPCSKDGKIVVAVKQCLDCWEYYCGKCISFHDKFATTSSHKVVDKKQMRKVQGSKPKIPLPTQRCLDHHERITTYCADHDVICCNTCMSINHKNCDGMDVRLGQRHEAEGRTILQQVGEHRKTSPRLVMKTNVEQFLNDLTILGNVPDVSMVYTAKLMGDYNIKIQQDRTTCDSTVSSCPLQDGTVVLTDWNNKRLKRLDASYRVTDHFDMHSGSWGVTCTAPDEVAVTLRERKKVQFVSVRESMSMTRTFSTSDKCRGICCSAGELFVSCGGTKGLGEGPGHVAVYSLNGDHLRTIQTDSSGQQLFSTPLHITTSPDGARIYVTQNNGVVSSDRSGKHVTSFTDPSLKNPIGVCTLDNGHVLVCGQDSHNVLQFDSDGRKVTELLKYTDGINRPTTLCYDNKNSRLVVTLRNTDKIEVYDLASSFATHD